MSGKTLTVNGLMRTLLVLLLGCGCSSAWSQQEPDPNADATTAAEPTAPPAPAASADKAAVDPSNENSPFDYQASEEISQDLSVSFPVDI